MRNCSVREKLQMHRIVALLVIGVVVVTSTGVKSAGAVEPAQVAHDTYCIACHDTSVYTRDDRLARDYDALREQVDRWQSNISLGWSNEDIDLMASWLATRYYRTHCPHGC